MWMMARRAILTAPCDSPRRLRQTKLHAPRASALTALALGALVLIYLAES